MPSSTSESRSEFSIPDCLPSASVATSDCTLTGFHLLGGAGGIFPYLPPKTFIVKLNNNCIKFTLFFALSSAVLYCIIKTMRSHKNTLAKAFMLRQEGIPFAMAYPPKQKILDETLTNYHHLFSFYVPLEEVKYRLFYKSLALGLD